MPANTNSARLIAILAATLMLFGCATSQRMTTEDKAKISAVRISDSVEKGQVFLLAPGGANVGLMFGALGGAAASGSIENARTAFADYLARNAVSIEKIVREEVEVALRSSGKLAIAGSPDTAAPTMKIAVPQYGFGVTHLLGSNVVPVLQISCEMIDGSGKVVRSASDRMLPSVASSMNAIAWTQVANDPKQMEAQWRKAARYLADMLFKQL